MTDVRVSKDVLFGRVDHGLELAQHFVHENRIRQAASSLGAAQHCIETAVAYANGGSCGTAAVHQPGHPVPAGRAAHGGGDAPPADPVDGVAPRPPAPMEVTYLVAMCNYRANRLACDAADRAMQTCGGVGYSRHMPFEHIYRHHRRYRITEGAEEIQMRKVAQELFGFGRNR